VRAKAFALTAALLLVLVGFAGMQAAEETVPGRI